MEKPKEAKQEEQKRVISIDLQQLLNGGISQFVQNLKNNVNLWAASDSIQFAALLIKEAQKFNQDEFPLIKFDKFLHGISRIAGKTQVQNEINSQAAKYFNCQLIEIKGKAARKLREIDQYDGDFVDEPLSDDFGLINVGSKQKEVANELEKVVNEPETETSDETEEEQEHSNPISDDDL
ncbi:Hypothetical_protein [Hexamita inflata]|uniref:Hypothetical_protein n=1 Tax=Hexamita inflata TaxID=28002 RepID=A0AA86NC49_9EUKA|nr:Hypothetical protein HINF_LOCUS4582 [Hexamita inflata]CAI9916940.1 Hypothetical protein HINF_LOCUS4585 [Hexamita inflata]